MKLLKRLYSINKKPHSNLSRRFIYTSVVMIGPNCDLFAFPLLFASKFSSFSFIQVIKKNMTFQNSTYSFFCFLNADNHSVWILCYDVNKVV